MSGATYTVERRIRVGAPPATVYERIVDFRRWPTWSPWEDLDPTMAKTYEGADAGVGAVYAWSGNRKVGEGRMEITGADADREVEIDLRFLKPFKSHNTTRLILEPDGDGTVVTWQMVAPHSLMTRVMGIFRSMDAMIGPDFEKGLERLRADAESA